MTEIKTVKDLVGIQNYLNVANELVELNFEFIYHCFEKYLNLRTPWMGNFEIDYRTFINHLLYYFFFNNIILRKKLKEGWCYLKITNRSKEWVDIPIWPLIIKYQRGRESGEYNGLKSFQKVLDDNLISLNAFKTIWSVFGGYRRGFDLKIP